MYNCLLLFLLRFIGLHAEARLTSETQAALLAAEEAGLQKLDTEILTVGMCSLFMMLLLLMMMSWTEQGSSSGGRDGEVDKEDTNALCCSPLPASHTHSNSSRVHFNKIENCVGTINIFEGTATARMEKPQQNLSRFPVTDISNSVRASAGAAAVLSVSRWRQNTSEGDALSHHGVHTKRPCQKRNVAVYP
ncbi:hypothetical protein CCH79_00000687 [Gambusia affinis]|uniref:Uncharacterized protein n=1 Tax=Gambusia affinis TaxID=33528 RepID=A0A315VTU5_GAMAF|nr:hypothetical protein CCH79_00000687 [Gambusia affinis]